MIENLLPYLAQWGIGGLVLLGCGWFLYYRDKAHREERCEWRKTIQAQHNETLEESRLSRTALNNNTSVLTELKTIINARNA